MRDVNTGQRWRLPWALSIGVLVLSAACEGPDREYVDDNPVGGVGGTPKKSGGGPGTGGTGVAGGGGASGSTSTSLGGASGNASSAGGGAAGVPPVSGAAGSPTGGGAGTAGSTQKVRNTSNRMAAVSGGHLMTSSNYRLLLTNGEAPAGNSVMSSANYQLQCGFVGVSQ
jgi:hypothetical protein